MDKVKDEIDIEPVYVKGAFGLYNINDLMEKVNLDGHYGIKIIKHDESYTREWDENIMNQSVFHVGRVLYRNDTEDILNLINMFAEYTYKDLKEVNKCNTVPKVMVGGTICPTRKELFTYKSKFFVAFGRYIFGYDENHAIIKKDKEGVVEEDNEGEEDEEDEEGEKDYYWKEKSKIDENKIIVSVPIFTRSNYYEDEYVYSFLIYDTDTGILDAFGMYR
ncbi:hypothetical protein Zmor_007076 [Zophobas morio]|uniref:Uncharacterized protein n=1 Tax=Zophobas morio TaxID=2755281 RepID=A0AA38IWN9_9CUCU|nr:hypothetical protein Zmor_007076 [Zophobas morio]